MSSILFDHGSGAVGSIQGTSSPVLWTVEGKPPCSHGSPHRRRLPKSICGDAGIDPKSQSTYSGIADQQTERVNAGKQNRARSQRDRTG